MRATAYATDRRFSRVGAFAAALGLLVYAASVVLHPGIPPHETATAFEHYAREPFWGVIHLAELVGILLMCVTGLALTWRLRHGAGGIWGIIAGAAMIVFAGVYAVFTAVDGVALGVAVRRWAEAGMGQNALFETAYAIRQVEAGLFALQWFVFGIAAGLFSPAFLMGNVQRRWAIGMGSLSAMASAGTLAFGVVQAQTGFSEVSMAFQSGLYLGVLWIVAAGAFLYGSPVDSSSHRSASAAGVQHVK